jgi:recombination protein RecA
MARKPASVSHRDRVADAIREKFGKGSVVKLSDGLSSAITSVIPTGLRALDNYVIGKIGGLPSGRMIEVYSPEGLGKTALALRIAALCLAMGGVAVWVDAEQTFDPDRAITFGVDPDALLMISPTDAEGNVKSGEDIGAEMETALKTLVGSPGPNLLVIDSIDAIQSRDVLEKGLSGEERIGSKGKLTSRLCRLLNPLAARAHSSLFLINQLRDKIGVMFGETTTTPGGNAIKFYSSLRLKISGGKRIEEGGVEIGKYVKIKAVKNKLDVPAHEIEARFLYATGWDDDWTTLNFAKDRGDIPASTRLSAKSVEAAAAALDEINWGRGGTASAEPQEAPEEDVEEEALVAELPPEEGKRTGKGRKKR